MIEKYPHIYWLAKGAYSLYKPDMYYVVAKQICIKCGYIEAGENDKETDERFFGLLAQLAFDVVFSEWELFMAMFHTAHSTLNEAIEKVISPFGEENGDAEKVFKEQLTRMALIVITLMKSNDDMPELPPPSSKVWAVLDTKFKIKEEQAIYIAEGGTMGGCMLYGTGKTEKEALDMLWANVLLARDQFNLIDYDIDSSAIPITEEMIKQYNMKEDLLGGYIWFGRAHS